jgi:hypothetical protein
MTVGVDTYVLPEESNALISQVLPASNPLRQAWEVLDDDEKEGYLAAALRRLENLNFAGERVWAYQPLKFPRIARRQPIEFDGAPVEVQRAQAVWATEILREELFIKKRNIEVCRALGIPDAAANERVPVQVEELLHRWLTSWRKV